MAHTHHLYIAALALCTALGLAAAGPSIYHTVKEQQDPSGGDGKYPEGKSVPVPGASNQDNEGDQEGVDRATRQTLKLAPGSKPEWNDRYDDRDYDRDYRRRDRDWDRDRDRDRDYRRYDLDRDRDWDRDYRRYDRDRDYRRHDFDGYRGGYRRGGRDGYY